MRYYYITKSEMRSIKIPFVPRLRMKKDKYQLINTIFGNIINPKYEDTCKIIIDAIKFQEPAYWEEAADMILFTDIKDSSLWAEHFIRISNSIKNPRNKKIKSSVLFKKEDPIVKFKRILKGYI